MTDSAAATVGDATEIDALIKGVPLLLRFMQPDDLIESLMSLAKTQTVPLKKRSCRKR
jgi:hypothetical protein